MKSKHSKERKSKYYEEFEPIKAEPEVVAAVIMKSPPKKKDAWRYLEKLKGTVE